MGNFNINKIMQNRYVRHIDEKQTVTTTKTTTTVALDNQGTLSLLFFQWTLLPTFTLIFFSF